MTTPPSQLDREIAEVLNTDRSTHSTVVEYAVQNLFKRQGPKKAAENTVKSLAGSPNMMLGVYSPDVVKIDQARLEEELWERLVDNAIKGMARLKPDKLHFAIDGTVLHFHQGPTTRKELKRRVIARLGRDPFEGLE